MTAISKALVAGIEIAGDIAAKRMVLVVNLTIWRGVRQTCFTSRLLRPRAGRRIAAHRLVNGWRTWRRRIGRRGRNAAAVLWNAARRRSGGKQNGRNGDNGGAYWHVSSCRRWRMRAYRRHQHFSSRICDRTKIERWAHLAAARLAGMRSSAA